MSILRVHKNENFTVIHNGCLQDKDISFKAKGIWAYLMTKPDDWQVKEYELAGVSKDGASMVSSGIKELINRGYMTRRKYQDDRGLWKWETNVFETPQGMEAHDPLKSELGQSKAGKSVTGKPKNITKTELTKTELTSKKNKAKKEEQPLTLESVSTSPKPLTLRMKELYAQRFPAQVPSANDVRKMAYAVKNLLIELKRREGYLQPSVSNLAIYEEFERFISNLPAWVTDNGNYTSLSFLTRKIGDIYSQTLVKKPKKIVLPYHKLANI